MPKVPRKYFVPWEEKNQRLPVTPATKDILPGRTNITTSTTRTIVTADMEYYLLMVRRRVSPSMISILRERLSSGKRVAMTSGHSTKQ